MSECKERRMRGPNRTFLKAFQRHNDQVAALVGIQYCKSTLTRFKMVRKHAQAFIQHQYGRPDFPMKDISPAFVDALEFYLKSVKRIDHNTTMKYLACCRKIVLRAIRSGWITRDPFLGISLAPKEVHRQALTETELETLITGKLGRQQLELTRAIFLFCCYTGLAYADVKKLRQTDIIVGIDQKLWISVHRQKTGSPSRVPLLPPALEILQHFSNKEEQEAEFVLPVLSNQKMNGQLKEIADQCGISKRLTVHLARHTFATTVTLSNGVPMETVSKMLGHRNIRTTQVYAKIVDRKVSEDMAALRDKFRGGG